MGINRSIAWSFGAVTTIAAMALAAGCGGGTHTSRHSTEPSPTATTSSPSASAKRNQADIAFAQGMIPHHQQAVQMAELAESRTSDPQVKTLAAKIKAAQAPEIEQLMAWLRDWGAPAASSGGHGMHAPGDATPGMMTDQEMAELEDARDSEFDRMFLEMMIRHHQGAVQMANAELEQGENPAAKGLAEKIKADQTAEISQMRSLSGK